MNAEGFGGQRHLTYLLNGAGLGGEGDWRLEQRGPIPDRYLELKAWKQSADDHYERMFAFGSDGTTPWRSS
jgi:hypothetical protein